MKKIILLLSLVIAAGAGAYWLTYSMATKKKQAYMYAVDEKTLAWLKKEYDLSPEQFARIKVIHDNYQPICEKLCAKINESNQKVKKLIYHCEALSDELSAALDENAAIRAECHRHMLQHIYAVYAEMNPEQGRRYLAMMSDYLMSPGRSIDEVTQNTKDESSSRHVGH